MDCAQAQGAPHKRGAKVRVLVVPSGRASGAIGAKRQVISRRQSLSQREGVC